MISGLFVNYGKPQMIIRETIPSQGTEGPFEFTVFFAIICMKYSGRVPIISFQCKPTVATKRPFPFCLMIHD
jgi:hypothetical protein